MRLKSSVRFWASFAACLGVAIAVQPPLRSLPPRTPSTRLSSSLPRQVAAATTVDPASVRGGRGPEHCALAVGIFLGGALGFFANPFLGTAVMRLGFMAAALHCA